jgi:hypothetical protein
MIEALFAGLGAIMKIAFAPLLIITMAGFVARPIVRRVPIPDPARQLLLKFMNWSHGLLLALMLGVFALGFTMLAIEGKRLEEEQKAWQTKPQ